MTNDDRLVLAAHAIKFLYAAEREGSMVNLDDVAVGLGMPRGEVRSCLSGLHHDGLVDVLRMRLTRVGFDFGAKLAKSHLAPLPMLGARTAA